MTDKIETDKFNIKIKYETVVKFSETDDEVHIETSEDSIEIFTDENKILNKKHYEMIYIYLLHRMFLWGKDKLNKNNLAMAKCSMDIFKLIYEEEETNGKRNSSKWKYI